jgi:hypothetical protein
MNDLFVEEVSPAPDCGHLLVHVVIPVDRPVMEALSALRRDAPRPKCEEVARNRRPLAASCAGCGGPQQIVPAALLGGSVKTKTLTFPTEVPDVRRPLG